VRFKSKPSLANLNQVETLGGHAGALLTKYAANDPFNKKSENALVYGR